MVGGLSEAAWAKRLGHAFQAPALRTQALTHRSAGSRNYERFEFLGDALLKLVVAETLFQRFTDVDEGALTRARAVLVRESSLADLARALHLGDLLILGQGELKSGGFRRDSILADAFEALIAAIYLDAGMDACREWVLAQLDGALSALPKRLKAEKDPKTRLQEFLQSRQFALPEYELTEVLGDEHERHFKVCCRVASLRISGCGEGSSRRTAEQQAATDVLNQMTDLPTHVLQ